MASSGLLLRPTPVENFKSAGNRHNSSIFKRPTTPEIQDFKPIQVFVATLEQNTPMALRPLEVSEHDTIDSIKLRVQSTKFCIDQKRLVCGSKSMALENRQLDFCRGQHGDVLNVMLRLSDLVSLTVRTVHGESFLYRVWEPQSLKELKTIASDKDEFPISVKFATLKGEYVEDSSVIEELTLKGEAVLCLSVTRPTIRSISHGRAELELVVTSQDGFSYPKPVTKTPVPSFWSTTPTTGNYSSFSLFKHWISFRLSDLSDRVRNLIQETKMGLTAGHAPMLTKEGSGGVYLMKGKDGVRNVAVFKPMDEEPMAKNNPRGFSNPNNGEGLKRGTRSGEGAMKEVAAYILDHPLGERRARTIRDVARRESEGFSGVPPTVMMTSYNEAFHYSTPDINVLCKAKTGSLQQFVNAISSCEDMGSSKFPVEEVHKISVLDLRLANTDRNGGNILVCRSEDGALKLVPIDHGYCLPENFEECTFEWLYWPQAEQPYSPCTLDYIDSLDAEEDLALLEQCGWTLRPKMARTLRISAMVLKKGAAAGLTPFEIGMIMSRAESMDKKSPIELIIEKAEAESSYEHELLNMVSWMLDEHIASILSGNDKPLAC